MGVIVSASHAAVLVDRHERIVRGWIQTGKLVATRTVRNRWDIDTDDLISVPYLNANQRENVQEYAASVERRELSLLPFQQKIEHDIDSLRQEVRELRDAVLLALENLRRKN